MKMIDADALMIVYTPYEFMSDMGDAMEILANFPTVDAIPVDWIESQVDKGKWAELVQRWAERAENE